MQYLTWALEAIEKFGHQVAADHTRIALEELRRELLGPSDQNNEQGS